jgi:signal peptidase II
MASAADRRLFWGTTVAVLGLDIASKLWAEQFLARRLPLDVLGELVQFNLVYNKCAAFGICLGEYSRWIFLVLAVVALFVLGSMVRHTRPGDRMRLAVLGLLCAGAAGNIVDRVRSAQGVVDFIFVNVGVGDWRWPTFNVADSAITVGACALFVILWLEGKAHDSVKEAGTAPAP